MTAIHGDLPKAWARVRVDEVGEVRLGCQRSPARQIGDYSTMYLRAANITNAGLDLRNVLEMDFLPEERARFRLQAGDVVVAEASGSASQVGRAALWQGELKECCYQNTVIRFRPHAAIPGYALLAFEHLRHSGEIAKVARGVGIQHIGARRFSGLSFPLPPWEEQQRIVAEANRRLGELVKAEAELRSALEKVEEQMREIYAAATWGTIRRRTTEEHAIRGGEAGGDDGQSEFGRIDPRKHALSQIPSHGPETLPCGWSWSEVGELGMLQLGVTRSPDRMAGEQPRKYLRSANIKGSELDLAVVAEMDISEAEAARFDLRDGDLLIAEASGSPEQVGRSVVWRGEIAGCSYQNHIIRLRTDEVLAEYLHLVITHYRLSGVLAKVAKGVGIQHLGIGRLSRLRVPLPPRRAQRSIVKEAERRLNIAHGQGEAARKSLERVELMKREVVAAAVSGELAPQREADESARELLKRLGPPPRTPVRERRGKTKRAGDEVKRREAQHRAAMGLVEVSRREKRPLPAAELFLLAGYDRNSPEEVEQFYLDLRNELGTRLRIVGDLGENQLVEAIPDAPQ